MARMTVSVNEGVIEEFRKISKKNFGTGRGAFGKAIEEAIVKWVEKEKQSRIKI